MTIYLNKAYIFAKQFSRMRDPLLYDGSPGFAVKEPVYYVIIDGKRRTK